MNADVQSVLVRTGTCGVIGACFGGVLASFRPQASIPFYIVGVGSNFAIIGGTYFGINQTLLTTGALDSLETERVGYLRHGISGLCTGGMWMSVYGGLRRSLYGAAAFASAGCVGYYAFERFETWRLAKRDKLRKSREAGER